MSKKDYILLLLIVAFLVAAILVYPQLPPEVPGHWNIQGEVDQYVSREFGAFFGPGLALGIYLLMLVVPKIDPKGENYEKYGKAWPVFRWAIILFLLALSAFTWATAMGYGLNIGKIVGSMTAVFFIVLGNYIPKVQYRNYTFGLRTPWTLDNEEVWRDTHRWAGKIMVGGGVMGLVAVLINETVGFYFLMAGVLLPSLGAAIYSYFRFKQLNS